MQILPNFLRVARRVTRPLRALRMMSLALCLVGFSAASQASQSILLSWDASPDPTVVGYNVYCGTSSGVYTNLINAGSALSVTIPGIQDGVTYYFAVTAYDSQGEESIFSNEVSYTAPIAPASQLSIVIAGDGTVSLNGSGQAGHVYEIQATTNFVSWDVIGTQTADGNGAFAVTADPSSSPMRFFRFRDTTP